MGQSRVIGSGLPARLNDFFVVFLEQPIVVEYKGFWLIGGYFGLGGLVLIRIGW